MSFIALWSEAEINTTTKYVKWKKHEELIREYKFLQACFNNQLEDIFSELWFLRNKNGKVSIVIDGLSESDEIAENFKDIYHLIYNFHNDDDKFTEFKIHNDPNIH